MENYNVLLKVFQSLESKKPLLILGLYGSEKTHILETIKSLSTNITLRENIQNQELLGLLNQDEFQNCEVIYFYAVPNNNIIDLLNENLNHLISPFNIINKNLTIESNIVDYLKILIKKFKKKKKLKTTLLILIDEFENIMGSMDREQINRNFIFIQRFAEIITQKNEINLIIASQNKLPEELEERFNIIEI